MTWPPSHSDRCAVVSQLRTAGCVFAEDEAGLLIDAAGTPLELATMVARRAGGLPLEHVLGWARFCGLRIAVDPGVFVPRRRTEFLARQAATLARQVATLARRAAGLTTQSGGGRPVVVDLCCGSGVVGASLLAAVPGIEVYAADIDPAATRCARRNLPAGRVYDGDLYDPLPAKIRGRVEVLVANVPYVPTTELGLLPAEARLHEPSVALDGGSDGLDVLRRVAADAPSWLAPGGHLLVETSVAQAGKAADCFAGNGLVPRVASDEEVGATVVIGAYPGNRR